MSPAPSKQVIEQIRKDLFSTDEATLLQALSRCSADGNITLIEPLILLFFKSQEGQVREEAADILRSIKVANAEEPFMEALLNPEYKVIRKDILSFIWNSGLQPVGWIADITRIAVEGSLEEIIECLTLVESMDDLFPEEQVLDSVQLVREYLNEAPMSEKSKLLAAFLGLLESLEQD